MCGIRIRKEVFCMQEAKLSVFSLAYWRTARAEFRNVRVLAFAGLVCAMAIVLELSLIHI